MKRREAGKGYCLPHQKGVKATWYAVINEMVYYEAVQACNYSAFVYSARLDSDVKDFQHIEDDEIGLFHDQNCTFEKLWPSVSYRVRLIVQSPFDGVRQISSVRGFNVLTDVCNVL